MISKPFLKTYVFAVSIVVGVRSEINIILIPPAFLKKDVFAVSIVVGRQYIFQNYLSAQLFWKTSGFAVSIIVRRHSEIKLLLISKHLFLNGRFRGFDNCRETF